MATVIVKDVISASLRLINCLSVGDTLDADTANNALYALNDMIDGWNLEPLMIWTIDQQTFNLTPGKRDYQLGPTAVSPDWTATRPVIVNGVNVTIAGMDYQLDELGDDEWEAIGLKGLGSSIPTSFHNHGDWPNTVIAIWPVPGAAYPVTLYVEQNIPSFATINDTVSLPPGYAEAIRYGLAERLAIELQRPLDPVITEAATAMKAKIKRINQGPAPLLKCDDAILGGPRWGSLSDFLGGR